MAMLGDKVAHLLWGTLAPARPELVRFVQDDKGVIPDVLPALTGLLGGQLNKQLLASLNIDASKTGNLLVVEPVQVGINSPPLSQGGYEVLLHALIGLARAGHTLVEEDHLPLPQGEQLAQEQERIGAPNHQQTLGEANLGQVVQRQLREPRERVA